jgi:nitrogen PTS system EIIA component
MTGTKGKAAFDVFIANSLAHNKKRIFEILAEEMAPLCGISPQQMFDYLTEKRMHENTSLGGGVLVLDMRTPEIAEPAAILMTIQKPMPWDGSETEPVDIIAAVFSPIADESKHLQKLAIMSRLLKSEVTCATLRAAESSDVLHVLLMPPEESSRIAA